MSFAHALRGLRLVAVSALAAAAPLTSARPLAAQGAPKAAAKLTTRTAKLAVERGIVDVTVAYRDVFDGASLRKLTTGLPAVVTTRSYVFREAGGDPIALAAKSCRVVYDLWDEVFRIDVVQPGGSSKRVALNVEGVLRLCAEARRMPLVEQALLSRGERYFAAFIVEVNPLSPEMLERIKRWVARPAGSSALGPADALFGSFVGLFVTRVQSADRRLSFRTQPFVTATQAPAPPTKH